MGDFALSLTNWTILVVGFIYIPDSDHLLHFRVTSLTALAYGRRVSSTFVIFCLRNFHLSLVMKILGRNTKSMKTKGFVILWCRIEPRYQEMKSGEISEASKDGVEVRVVAGEALGIKSPIYTRTPTMFLDFTLNPGAKIRQPIPESWNAFVYVLEGEGVFGNSRSSPVSPHHLLLLGPGDGLKAWNKSSKPLRFVLVGGEPLGEPVVQYGPFVMNNQEEIDQTIEDFENCTNGFEKARHWKSQSTIVYDY